MSDNWADQMAAYRFFDNEKVTEKALIEELTHACSLTCTGRDLLIMADTCSYNLNSQRNRVQLGTGLGLIENDTSLGFYMHNCLAVDANTNSVLGISDCQLWHRDATVPNKTERNYWQLNIEQKTSFRWIKGCQKSKETLRQARSLTFVEDREGDIYEQFAMVPDEKAHLIIRSRDNRRLSNNKKLYDSIAEQEVIGFYHLLLEGDNRIGRKRGYIKVEVRAQAIEILRPENKTDKSLPDKISLWVVEAKECDSESKKPICWRLLTDIPVFTFDEALGIINRYKQRWYIEELHRITKKQGYNLEDTQLEKGWAIRKLTVMLLRASIRIMQMWLAYDNEEGQDTDEVFSSEEIQFLDKLNDRMKSTTEEKNNPYNPRKLTWATWIIARLGGWKGFKKQHKPGPIILIRGYEKFQNMYQGWELAKLYQKDVYKR